MMHIDHDAVVAGRIVVAGAVRLDGRLEGVICCSRLEIGRWGRVEGRIEADEVVVEGEVVGDILARQVWLRASAVVEGDVTHAGLVVDGRAVLVGDSHRDAAAEAPLAVRRLRQRVAAEDAELAGLEQAVSRQLAIVPDRGSSRGAREPVLD